MARWQFRKAANKKQPKPRSIRKTHLMLEELEDRRLLTGTPTVLVPGVTATVFATNPSGTKQPDSIAVDGQNVYVGYGNGVAKDGSDGKTSTIVQYNTTGTVIKTYSVPGHNDGLKVDPATHLVWSLQNEDGNPNLVIINPFTFGQTNYTFATPDNGGGYDDITFLKGKVYLTESAPASNPNNASAVVQATLSGTMVNVQTVLFGNATAFNLVTHMQEMLNLQDPDSMTADPEGNLVLTSQADNELVTIHNPGTASQSATLLPLTDATSTPVAVDDTLFPRDPASQILLTDLKAGIIYRITGPVNTSKLVLSAAADIGQLGTLNTATGLFKPVITGLGSPRGLAVLQPGPVGVTGDFEGDGKPDLAVWRPSDGTWHILLSSKNFDPNQALNIQWGLPGDIPIPNSDFDGDGKTDLAVWRPSNGTWYVLLSSRGYDPRQALIQQWGLPGDIPLPHSDVDGNHNADLAVWRPSTGTWYVLLSSTFYDPNKAIQIQWGLPGDVPIQSSDFDGDGKMDLAVWRPSNGAWFVLLSSKGYDPNQALIRQWGLPGDIPIQHSDFDGDHTSDLAVWRPSNGTWYILLSSKLYDPTQALIQQWGLAGDIPLQQSDIDGNKNSDLAVWRPSTGTWYVLQSSKLYDPNQALQIQWGLPGDIPIQTADFDGDGKMDLGVWRPSTGTWYVLYSSKNYDPTQSLQVQFGLPYDYPV